jgi:probable HAF family extracellular repeat protein
MVVFSGVQTAVADVLYSFTTIDPPGATNTSAHGINNSGQIAGIFQDSSSANYGFLYSAGSFTTINVPGATNISANGINDSGQIVGSYGDSTRDNGFLYSAGSFTAINVPGAMNTGAGGINNSGQIVGSFTNFSFVASGFLDTAGSLTTINVPGAFNTRASGINNSGQIVGTYIAGSGSHGFLATPVPEPGTLPLLTGCLIGLATILPKLRKS